MIFGFNNLPKDMDVFDNEYFQIISYDWNQNHEKLDNAHRYAM